MKEAGHPHSGGFSEHDDKLEFSSSSYESPEPHHPGNTPLTSSSLNQTSLIPRTKQHVGKLNPFSVTPYVSFF